ncbi:hypothetical protein BDW68DRAFT_170636 [Aspergillus falconensis]
MDDSFMNSDLKSLRLDHPGCVTLSFSWTTPKTEGGWTCCKCDGYNSHSTRKCKDCSYNHEKCNLCTNDTHREPPLGESYTLQRSVGGLICLPATMERFWTCCTCGNLNDSHFSTESCCSCNHKKCSYCHSV